MKVFEAIAHEIARQNVGLAFGLLGEDVARFIAMLPEVGIEYVGVHHEASVAGMADGYARATGGVGVGVVSRGCGLTNAYTSLTNAAKCHSPVVVFTGDSAIGLEDPSVATSATWAPKHLDQAGALAAAGIDYVILRDPASAVADVAAVFAVAQEGRTVVVNIPTDVLEAVAGTDPSQLFGDGPSEREAPDPGLISDVADLIETDWAARHVVILAGRGAVRANAKSEIERLGARCGAAFATTLLAKSFFRESPYDLGIMGTFATPTAVGLLQRADVLLVFGAALNGLTTFGGELPGRAMIIQFDTAPSAFGRYTEPFMAIEGDARLAAAALADELERRGHQATGYRTPEVAAEIAAEANVADYSDQSDDDGMDPRTLLTAINGLLPKDARVVVDPGHHGSFLATFLTVESPSRWVWPFDYPAVGSGMPIALGAALGDPDHLTVLGIGDGGLMMTLGELETAIRYDIPMLVLVLNDAALGAEVHFLQLYGMSDETARFADVQFAAIASAMGADALTVKSTTDLEELRRRLERVEDWRGPLVVDCKVTTAVRAEFISSWDRLTAPQAVTEPAAAR